LPLNCALGDWSQKVFDEKSSSTSPYELNEISIENRSIVSFFILVNAKVININWGITPSEQIKPL
jgi:hypothetical protein